jgi:predicted membrane metal-binding protein
MRAGLVYAIPGFLSIKKMKPFISTKFHAVLDYVGGIIIVASPWIFGFHDVNAAAMFLPILFGGLQLVMLVFTDHEGGLIRVIPMRIHLFLDMLVGFILMVSPFLYGFYPYVFLPHVLLGLLSFGAGIFTHQSSFLDKTHTVNSPSV